MIDGIAGMTLMQMALSPIPDYEIHEAPRFVPRTAPSGRELLRASLVRWASLPLQVVRGWQHFRRHTANLTRELRLRAASLADVLSITVQTAPETPLNGCISPHRRFDWVSMPLRHFKAVSKALDCTVNDVVLATVAGAVREFLMSRGVRPDEIDFRVSTPVNVRSKVERGSIGNRASTWLLDLPIGEADPRKRVEAIHQAEEHGIKILIVTANRKRQAIAEYGSCMIPAYIQDHGTFNRQCTTEWKRAPIRRWLQAHRNGAPVEIWLGISLDEFQRMKQSDVKYITHRWPLIDMRMTRNDCMLWLDKHGLEIPPKSACTFCPFHNTAEWRRIKNIPEDWDEAVAVDRAIRKARPPYDLFVHPARIPLENVDLRTPQEKGQLSLWDKECSGLCGV